MEAPSPFAPYLGTNYAATGDEAKKLEEFLVQPIAKLARLKEELNRIESRYDAVVQQCNALSKIIDDHRSLIAPIRHLPVDIVQEIFIQCLPHEHNAIMSQIECPILLTRICSSWRQVALNTPALWTSIHIPIPEHVDPSTQPILSNDQPTSQANSMETARRRAQGIKEWLNRSGSCTLDITLITTYHWSPSMCRIHDIILDSLLPFSERWGSLTCNHPASRYLTRIANLPVIKVPRLHTLDISSRLQLHWTPPGITDPALLTLQAESIEPFWKDSDIFHAPNLRNITYYSDTHDPDVFAMFPIRWSHLTSLSLKGRMGYDDGTQANLSLEKIANLLLACPRLQYLNLGITIHSVIDSESCTVRSPPFPIILLPCLTELVMDNNIQPNSSRFFDALEVPTLEVLRIFKSTCVLPAMLDLLIRTASTLRNVRTNPTFFTKSEFFDFVSGCGCLEVLDLETHRRNINVDSTMNTSQLFLQLDDEFFHGLLGIYKDNNARKILLPQLSVFKCNPSSQLSDRCVLDTVKARNRYAHSGTSSIAKLKIISISFPSPQTIPLADEINKVAEESVVCKFMFPFPPPVPIDRNSVREGLPHQASDCSWRYAEVY